MIQLIALLVLVLVPLVWHWMQVQLSNPQVRENLGHLFTNSVLAIAFLAGAAVVSAIAVVLQALRQKPAVGIENMVGEFGVADTDIVPDGKVLVRGVYWNARSNEPIVKGNKVEVVAVDGLLLTVRNHQD